MISIVLGLLISAIALQLFLTSQRSVTVQQAMMNLQSSALFGLGSVINSIRLANLNSSQPLDFLHKSFFNQFNCLSFTQSKLYMPASKLNRRFNLLRRFLYTQDKILKHFILPNTCST